MTKDLITAICQEIEIDTIADRNSLENRNYMNSTMPFEIIIPIITVTCHPEFTDSEMILSNNEEIFDNISVMAVPRSPIITDSEITIYYNETKFVDNNHISFPINPDKASTSSIDT